MEFDDILNNFLGNFSLFHVVLILLMGLNSLICGYQVISMGFMGAFPEFWCKVDRLQNFTFDTQKYVAIPFNTDGDYHECLQYDLPYEALSDEEIKSWNRSMQNDTATKSCNRWVYDQSEFLSTIVTEWDLTCGSEWLVSLVSTVWLLGVLVGAPLSGFISDRFGRRPTLLAAVVAHNVVVWGCAFSPNYITFTVLRFFISLTIVVCYLTGYVIVMEFTGAKYRTHAGVGIQIFFSVGFAITPGLSYFCRDFVKLQYIMAGPAALMFIYFWLIPESVRWLASQERIPEAMAIIHKMAKVNKVTLPDDLTVCAGDGKTDHVEKGKFSDLFKTPVLRREILIVYLGWFTCSLIYYGLSLNTGSLGGSIFLNTFISGAVEIPANLLCILFMEKLGRRITLAGSFILGGVSCLLVIIGLDNASLEWVMTTFAMIGKAAITMSFSCIYNYTAELFPTPIRHLAVGSSSMMARVSGLIAPFMGKPMMDVWKPLPSVIFGVFSISSGLLSLLLPETLNKNLPDTIEEAEEIGRIGKKKSPKCEQTNLAFTDTASDLTKF